MSESRHDECCPHCDSPIAYMGHHYAIAEYDPFFTFECPKCEKLIDCRVAMVPEFELKKSTLSIETDGATT